MKESALIHFQDKVNALVLDWKGQDEIFFHSRAIQTIGWWMGRAKSLSEVIAVYRKNERRKFIEAVCAESGMKERRAYEMLKLYQTHSKPSDSLMDTCERIFQKYGNMTKALKSGEKKEEGEPKCKNCFHCPK